MVEQLYTSARWFCTYDAPLSDRDLRKLFDVLCKQVDPKSSPGYPWVWRGLTTNLQVFSDPMQRECLWQAFSRMMRLLFDGKPLPLPTVRLFVKPEPHKIDKIREGRFRLIWALPLEYQLVHRHFFGPSLAAEIANYRTIPSKVGMSWTRGGAHAVYRSLHDAECDEIADVDKKGWDISVPEWLILMDMESRWRLCLNKNKLWRYAFEQCYATLLKSRVIFSDGTILNQIEGGIVRSGSMITLSANSREQVILKVMFCIDTVGDFIEAKHRVIAIGDDTLERLYGISNESYSGWLKAHGFTCKEISRGPLASRTFCSHTFKKHGATFVPVALNWEKHCYAMCYKEAKALVNFPEQLFSLQFEYCFDDVKFAELQTALIATGSKDKCWSQEMMQNFFTGFETATSQRSDDISPILIRAADDFPPAPRLVGIEENPGPIPNDRDSFELWIFDTLLVFTLVLWALCGPWLRFGRIRHRRMLEWALTGLWILNAARTARVSAQDCLRTDSKYPNSAAQKYFDKFVTRPLLPAFEQVVHTIGKTLYPSQAHKFRTREEERADRQHEEAIHHRRLAYEHQLKSTQGKSLSSVASPKITMSGSKLKKIEKKIEKKVERALQSGNRKKAPRKNRSSVVVSSVPGSARNGMDYTCIRGSDYIAPLIFTGPASDGQQILEQPGQVTYKLQLQPFQMIPNSRLKKFGDLYEKWRFKKLSFEIRSTMSAMNAGNVLLVYEPNPLEATPEVTTGTAAGSTKDLSKYEAHSNVMVASVATKLTKEGGKAPVLFNVKTKLQKGPFGGWFFNDALGDEPLQNTSQGQFFIMVQDPMSCLGSAATGAYKAGVPITWASLICHYELELSVANDENDSFFGDPPVSMGRFVAPLGTYYANPLDLQDTVLTNWDDVGFVTFGAAQPGTPLDEIGLQFAMATLTPATTDAFHIHVSDDSPAKDFGVFLVMRNSLTSADMGTTAAGWTSPVYTPLTVSGGYSTRHTTLSTATAGFRDSLLVANLGPDQSLAVSTGGWTVGTGGSATATATITTDIFAFMVPYKIFHNLSAMMGIAAMAKTRPDLARLMPKYLLQMRKKEPSLEVLRKQIDDLKSARARQVAETKEEKKELYVLVEEAGGVSTPSTISAGAVAKPASEWAQLLRYGPGRSAPASAH